MRHFAFSALLLTLAGPSFAQNCAELSYNRNAIYARAGYCFKTSEQIRRFGNAGCQFDNQTDVPLSARDREIVARIAREERFNGCR